MTEDRLHDLLPWFLNGTLGEGESARFEAHLPACEPCRRELRALRELQGRLDRHGATFLQDHPAPERLVVLLGQGDEGMGEDEARGLRKHLSFCATCSEEARWISGEATAAGPAARGSRRRSVWGWAAAASFAALALAVWMARDSSGYPTGVVGVTSIEPTVRAAGEIVEITVPTGAAAARILVPLDLGTDALPLRLELISADDRVLHSEAGIGSDRIYSGRFLFFDCARTLCRDGNYRLLVHGRNPGDPAAEYPFRVVSAD